MGEATHATCLREVAVFGRNDTPGFAISSPPERTWIQNRTAGVKRLCFCFATVSMISVLWNKLRQLVRVRKQPTVQDGAPAKRGYNAHHTRTAANSCNSLSYLSFQKAYSTSRRK